MLAIVAVFLLALIAVRLLWIQLHSSPPQADATDGWLDLREWDWSKEPQLTLNGEWAFYPYQFIEPGQRNRTTEDSQRVSLPSSWRGMMKEGGDSAYGYASYQLRILVEPGVNPVYSLRVPAVPASAALYVNGQRVGGSGQPAERREDYEPGNVPFTATFAQDKEEIHIVIHVANYDDRVMSGIMQPIRFGTEAAIDRSYMISAGTQLAVCLLLLMHVLYAIVLYFIGVKQKALIYFSLMIICAITAILIDDERILPDWYSVSFEWNWKLYYLSFLGVAVFILFYAKNLVPTFSKMRYFRWFAAACGLFAVFVLLLPARVLSYFDMIHTLFVLLPFFVVPMLSVRAIRRGEADMIFVLLGMTAITNNVIWGAIKNTGIIESGFYPIDTIVSFMSLALYWFKNYFRASDRTTKLAEQLQAADKQKDEFLASTSHELRNPLHGMLNIAQSVIDNDPSGGGGNAARLRLLVSIGKRMSYMLGDLLDLARFKENRIRLAQTSLPLQSVAAGVLDMLRYMTDGKPISLHNHVPDTLPPVFADENRLIQILFNLVHNAVKYTSEGEIGILARVVDGKVVVSVTDTGIGMSEATIARVFLPYEQGEVTETGQVTGLGLGLAICKQLVQLHGSELAVRSAPGEGSTFSFELAMSETATVIESEGGQTNHSVVVPFPFKELRAASQEAVAATSELAVHASVMASGEKSRILAVDDDPVNLTVLKSVLSEERYEIVTTTSGADAMTLLQSGSWDLIITDVMMPGMSGYEVARAVRSRFSRSELPVLLLTARSRAEDIEAGFLSGANDYIAKPVDAHELRARVGALTEVTLAAREQARMEAAWLQAQIEPHFLFNTLSTVSALGEIDIERMRYLLTMFGDYLRASFDFHNAGGLVPLQKELELVRAYIAIEKERFDERINVVWEVDEKVSEGLQIPPLSIQPLVENALRHGILQRSKGGTVCIRVAADGPSCVNIIVQDDGAGMDEEKLGSLLTRQKSNDGRRRGVGMANTDYRLKRLYGEGLRMESAPGKGTTVSFRVAKFDTV